MYGFGRMDESGRVADRATTSALGWQPGDRLTVTAAAGVVIARHDPVPLEYSIDRLICAFASSQGAVMVG